MNNSDLNTLDNIPIGLTVMVIDDSKTIRRTAEILLSEQGCKVLLASDGFESLAMIANDRPDVVFVDIMMPRLDGYQTCSLIKGHPEYRNIPVVMLSSKDSIFDMARGRLAGSESYITKPFTRNDLVTAIEKNVKSADTKDTNKKSESQQSSNDDMDFNLDDIENLEMTL